MTTKIPARGTREYDWWYAGAHAEVDARKEGRSSHGLDMVNFMDALAKHKHELSQAQMAAYVFRVYTADLPLWKRIRLALKGPYG